MRAQVLWGGFLLQLGSAENFYWDVVLTYKKGLLSTKVRVINLVVGRERSVERVIPTA